MSAAILNNRLHLPPGYRALSNTGSLVKYKPYNGFLSGAFNTIIVGVTQLISFIGSPGAPADLSTLVITAPNGRVFNFQFQYTAGGNPLSIKIPLATGAASTSAQVLAAVLAIFQNKTAGVSLGYDAFPWVAVQTGAAQLRLDYNVAGAADSVSGTSVDAESVLPGARVASFQSTNPVLPGIWGKNFCFLDGSSTS